MSKKQKGGENSMYFLEDDDLDIGEELPINAIPELTKKDDKRNPNQQTLRHLIDTSSRFSLPHLVSALSACVVHLFIFTDRRLCHMHALLTACS